MPKSKHRRKGRKRPRVAGLPGPSFESDLGPEFAAAEAADDLDDPGLDPDMAAALALAEAALAGDLDDDDLDDDSDIDRVAGPLFEAVENQVRANDPPAVAVTLARLLAAGHARDAAISLIGAILMCELNAVMHGGGDFDAARYARHLANLPDLPEAY